MCSSDLQDQVQVQRETELQLAWMERDQARAWRMARLLTRKAVGPKRRVLNQPIFTVPTTAQWLTTLSKPGSKGGCAATRIDIQQQRALAAEVPIQVTNWHRKQAFSLFKQMRYHISQAQLRRTSPEWAAPIEIWRMILLPTFVAKQRPPALECVVEDATPHCLHALIVDCLARTLASSPPLEWSLSRAFDLDKQNGKAGTASIRQVHAKDPVGKAFNRAMWALLDHPPVLDQCFGCVAGRRREEAIFIQAVTKWRMNRLGFGSTIKMFDIKNAFPSPDRKSVV